MRKNDRINKSKACFFLFLQNQFQNHNTMNTHSKTKRTRLALPLLFLIIGIFPAKAQLYVGGSLSIYTKEYKTAQNHIIKDPYQRFSIELGYRHERFSAGLTHVFYHQNLYDSYQRSFKPYLRYDLIVRDRLGFFIDAFYSYTYHNRSSDPAFPSSIHSHLIGLSPGIYYKMTNRLMALFHFGLAGYSSSAEVNDFKGFGIDLSMSTSQIGFYYSFW